MVVLIDALFNCAKSTYLLRNMTTACTEHAKICLQLIIRYYKDNMLRIMKMVIQWLIKSYDDLYLMSMPHH